MALNSEAAFQRQSSECTAANLTERGPQAPASMRSRVCDTCIRKKVKCNQDRPTCSRCLERRVTCTYSSKRRKPGPQPGLLRSSISSESRVISGRQQSYNEPDGVTETTSRTPSTSTEGHIVSQVILNQPYSANTQDAATSAQVSIGPNEEEHLLERYFDIIQDTSPIFSKAHFLSAYRNSLCDSSLISTMTTITAKLTRPMSIEDSAAIDNQIDSLLSSSTVEDDLFTNFPSLDQFRKSCILAIYEFHQFPGHQAWIRIGKLTRMAYHIGLDRLETLRARHAEWRFLSKEDMDEWRAVWWCIYSLDSYSNLSSGTPYLVDESLINTAMITCNTTQPSNVEDAPPQVLLSVHLENLWKLLPAVTSHPETLIPNINNITTTMLRKAGLLTRVSRLKPREETIGRITIVEQQLSALRLGLPPSWLNPKRNAFSRESHVDHHARLVTVLHLLMARLYLSILCCTMQQDEEWMMSWQQVLETCQNIASIAEQWDSVFCVKVDPSISFILFAALIFLDLQKKSTAISTSTLHSRIDHEKTVLHLQLEQFERLWTLPRLLNLSWATFSESISGPLTNRHIKLILSRFEVPLHPRWLQFLSTPQNFLENSPLN